MIKSIWHWTKKSVIWYTRMLNVTYEKAYAKVNFGLNVFSERGDGFHNIESIFQTVDLNIDKENFAWHIDGISKSKYFRNSK